MQTYTVAKLKSGNIAVTNKVPTQHIHSCLIMVGPKAGEWVEKGATFPNWGLVSYEVQAENALAAAKDYPSAVAAAKVAKEAREVDAINTLRGYYGCVAAAQSALATAHATINEMHRAAAEFKGDARALRAALRKAEAKAEKAKKLAAWQRLCAKAVAKLPAEPAAPLKGAGNVRHVIGQAGRNPFDQAVYAAFPKAHLDTLGTRSSGGNFGSATIISPEAYPVFAKLIQTAQA